MNAATIAVPLTIVAALAACGPAVSSTLVRGPDGKDNWVAITCKDSQGACFAEAGRVCPGGYDLADSEGHVGQSSSSYAQADSHGSVAMSRSRTTYTGEVLVHCHGKVGPAVGRECMSDSSCDTGVECVFSADAGLTDVGHCATEKK
jgi:hypothetical protein